MNLLGKRLIILDWGRTLYDPDRDSLYPGTRRLIQELDRTYQLALASVARSAGVAAERMRLLKRFNIDYFFSRVLISEEKTKFPICDQLLADFALAPTRVAIVDDRAAPLRGIHWGRSRGALSIWVQRGKYANELPHVALGEPHHTITNLGQLPNLLLKHFS